MTDVGRNGKSVNDLLIFLTPLKPLTVGRGAGERRVTLARRHRLSSRHPLIRVALDILSPPRSFRKVLPQI